MNARAYVGAALFSAAILGGSSFGQSVDSSADGPRYSMEGVLRYTVTPNYHFGDLSKTSHLRGWLVDHHTGRIEECRLSVTTTIHPNFPEGRPDEVSKRCSELPGNEGAIGVEQGRVQFYPHPNIGVVEPSVQADVDAKKDVPRYEANPSGLMWGYFLLNETSGEVRGCLYHNEASDRSGWVCENMRSKSEPEPDWIIPVPAE